MYKGIKVTTDNVRFKKAIAEVPSEPSMNSKAKIRLQIQDNVFDLEDSVADNAKMVSLLTSMMMRLYEVTPQAQKDLLTPQDKGMIEYVFTKFSTTNTRADVQFGVEGMAMVDKVLDRQGAIGNIISDELKLV